MNNDFEKEILQTYSPKLGVIQTGKLIERIRTERKAAYKQALEDCMRLQKIIFQPGGGMSNIEYVAVHEIKALVDEKEKE
jgi:hypothetical protein